MNPDTIIFPNTDGRPWLKSIFALSIALAIIFVVLGFLQHFYQMEIKSRDHDGYFMISKPVEIANTMLGNTSSFNEEELNAMREAPFTRNMAIVKKPNFLTVASFFKGGRFKTEIVLESMPDEMVDGASFRFFWDEGKKTVPIIISSDFLRLYNFVYAPIAKLPPVSIDNLSMLPIMLFVKGKNGVEKMQGEIIGLTDRYNGIFVPESFMDWANGEIAGKSEYRPEKVVIRINGTHIGDFEAFLQERGFESNMETMRLGKSAVLVFPVLGGLFVILIAFVLLAVSNFWLEWKWLLEKQKDNLEILYACGYHPGEITRFLFRKLGIYLGVGFFSATVLGMIVWFSASGHVSDMFALQEMNFPLQALVVLFALFALITLRIYLVAGRFCRKAYR